MVLTKYPWLISQPCSNNFFKSMKSLAWQFNPRPLVIAVIALNWFVTTSHPVSAADKNPATAKAAKGKKGEKIVAPDPGLAAEDGLGSMGDMIPQGMRNLQVRIPGFQQGRQSSLITADAVTKQTEKTLFAERMAIHMYSVKPEENVRVDLRTATYDLDTKVLSSQDRSRVSRSDFQLEGDSMVFDTITSQGKMKGRVEMIIFDANSLKKSTAQPTPTLAPPNAQPLIISPKDKALLPLQPDASKDVKP
jgi:hypothetical protein